MMVPAPDPSDIQPALSVACMVSARPVQRFHRNYCVLLYRRVGSANFLVVEVLGEGRVEGSLAGCFCCRFGVSGSWLVVDCG